MPGGCQGEYIIWKCEFFSKGNRIYKQDPNPFDKVATSDIRNGTIQQHYHFSLIWNAKISNIQK